MPSAAAATRPAWRCRRVRDSHLPNAAMSARAHSLGIGLMIAHPLLHRSHQLGRQSGRVVVQIHVGRPDIVDSIDREVRLRAMLDRIHQFGLQGERMIVIVDRLPIGAEAQMHVADVVPCLHHVALVAQRLGELIERSAVGIADFVHFLGLLVGITRRSGGGFVLLGLVQVLHRLLVGLLGRRIRFLDGGRGRRRVVRRPAHGWAPRPAGHSAGTTRAARHHLRGRPVREHPEPQDHQAIRQNSRHAALPAPQAQFVHYSIHHAPFQSAASTAPTE